MRTLTLSHEQIAIIQHALGIAEKIYTDKYEELIKLHLVRNNHNNPNESKIHIDHVFDLSTQFADLNTDINQNHLDV